MKHISFNPNNFKISNVAQNDEYFNIENQLQYLLQFQKNELVDMSLSKIIKKEISKKMSSYRSQDKKNGKYDEEQHVSYKQLITKLTSCEMKCYYCNLNLFLLYQYN